MLLSIICYLQTFLIDFYIFILCLEKVHQSFKIIKKGGGLVFCLRPAQLSVTTGCFYIPTAGYTLFSSIRGSSFKKY